MEWCIYTLEQVAALFSIDIATLRRWLMRVGMQTQIDPADRRRRYITETQLIELASLHNRVLLPLQHRPDTSSPSLLLDLSATLRQLSTRLDDLQRRVEHLERVISSGS